jgi:hypothetical protein
MLGLLLLALVAQGPAPPSATGEVVYLVTETTAIRAEPSPRASRVGRLHRFDVVSGRETVAGWLHIGSPGPAAGGGWIPIARENVVAGTMAQTRARLFRIQQAKWSTRIKIDVARGLVRRGYTAAQVLLALGDPVHKDLRHVGADVTEAWTYPDRRIIFSHTAVTAIELTTGK